MSKASRQKKAWKQLLGDTPVANGIYAMQKSHAKYKAGGLARAKTHRITTRVEVSVIELSFALDPEHRRFEEPHQASTEYRESIRDSAGKHLSREAKRILRSLAKGRLDAALFALR